MSSVNGRGGPLSTDRPTAENPDEKFDPQSPTTSPITDSPHGQQVRGCLVLTAETQYGKHRRGTLPTGKLAERTCCDAGQPPSGIVTQLYPVAVVL